MASRRRPSGKSLARKCGVEVSKFIGKGSYGEVYKGMYRGKVVAVKVVHSVLRTEEMQAKLRTECRILKHLDHENIIKFIDAVFDEDGTVLIMELMDQTLERFLTKNRGLLSWAKQADISWHIAFALEYMHFQEFLHRDQSSRNVLLDEEGTTVKISDLGQAKPRHSLKPLTGNAPGCVQYMPPECLRLQNPQFDAKGDVFSLGVVMLDIATQHSLTYVWEGIGTTPEVDRRAGDLSKVSDNHPLKSLIQQCLKDDPEERPGIHSIVQSLARIRNLQVQAIM